jgi:hypothetical protein
MAEIPIPKYDLLPDQVGCNYDQLHSPADIMRIRLATPFNKGEDGCSGRINNVWNRVIPTSAYLRVFSDGVELIDGRTNRITSQFGPLSDIDTVEALKMALADNNTSLHNDYHGELLKISNTFATDAHRTLINIDDVVFNWCDAKGGNLPKNADYFPVGRQPIKVLDITPDKKIMVEYLPEVPQEYRIHMGSYSALFSSVLKSPLFASISGVYLGTRSY